MNEVLAGRWRKLWLAKTGRAAPEELGRNFKVQLGRWTEGFNLRWLADTRAAPCAPLGEGVPPAGVLPSDARVVVHPEGGPYARRGRYSARPDAVGADAAGPFLVEAKHVADREAPERVVPAYLGQLFVSMHVLGLSRAVLSVIYGADRLTAYGIGWSDATWREVERQVDLFDGHLLLDVEPRDPPEPPHLGLPLPEITNRWRPARAGAARRRPAPKTPGKTTSEEDARCVGV